MGAAEPLTMEARRFIQATIKRVRRNLGQPILKESNAIPFQCRRASTGNTNGSGRADLPPNKRDHSDSTRRNRGGSSGGGPATPVSSSTRSKAPKTKHGKRGENFTTAILGITAGAFGAAALFIYTAGSNLIQNDKFREWSGILSSIGAIFFGSLFAAERLACPTVSDTQGYREQNIN